MPGIQTMLEINKPLSLRTDTCQSAELCAVFMILKTIEYIPAQLKVCGENSEAQQFHNEINTEAKTKILNWNKCHASNLDLCEDQPTFSWCHGLCVFCVSNI